MLSKAHGDSQIARISNCNPKQIWILKQLQQGEILRKDLVKMYNACVEKATRQTFMNRCEPLYEKNLIQARSERQGRSTVKYIKSLCEPDTYTYINTNTPKNYDLYNK